MELSLYPELCLHEILNLGLVLFPLQVGPRLSLLKGNEDSRHVLVSYWLLFSETPQKLSSGDEYRGIRPIR